MRIDNLLVRLYVTCIAIVTKYPYRFFRCKITKKRVRSALLLALI